MQINKGETCSWESKAAMILGVLDHFKEALYDSYRNIMVFGHMIWTRSRMLKWSVEFQNSLAPRSLVYVHSAPVRHRNRASHTSMLFEDGEHREVPFSTEKTIMNVYLFYRNYVRAAIC